MLKWRLESDNMHRLHVTFYGGLCNRLRSLSGALHVCEALNMTLVMDWHESDDMCPSTFEDLFQPIPGVITHLTQDQCQTVLHHIPWGSAHQGDWKKRFLPEEPDKEFWSRVTYWMKALSPVEEISESIERCKARMTSSTIGVHVRRTDLLIWDGNTHWPIDGPGTDELLIKRLDSEPEETTFFVATDNPESMEMLQERYGDRVIAHPKLWLDRFRKTDIGDTVVDLYCLAACSRIVGTHWSSFSGYASHLGDGSAEFIGIPRKGD